MNNLDVIFQVIVSGLLTGLLYALIAVGLSLIFGLMDVVNFAHGEFLMVSMFMSFWLVVGTGLDPLLMSPLVIGCMFGAGVVCYYVVIVPAMRAKANVGMVQIFATFGLAIVIRGAAQFLFTSDYRTISTSWVGGKTLQFAEVFVPLPQLTGAAISMVAFAGLWIIMKKTDFGRALEATREDRGAVGLVGIDKDRVFALGWGVGASLVGAAGAVMSLFYYIYPDVGAGFALTAYVTVALGGFGSVFGALAAGITIGLVEATSALILSPAMKAIGVYALYLAVIFLRPSGLFGRL